MANLGSSETNLDTADTYRFDMAFAEDKLNWVRQFSNVPDKVKVLEKQSFRVVGGYMVYCCHYSALLNRRQSFCVSYIYNAAGYAFSLLSVALATR